jgi:hypothetical protein
MRMVAKGVKRVPLSSNLACDVATEMPISAMVVALVRGHVSVFGVVPALMRPGPKAGPEGL